MKQTNSYQYYQAGAIPDHHFRQMMRENVIRDSSVDRVNPSSLDLKIDLESIYKVGCVFTPSKKISTIEDTLNRVGAKKVARTNGGYFVEKNGVYVARVVDKIKLPPRFFARTNPKSSTGRTDLHVRMMGDFISQYDRIIEGWVGGNLYVLICPKSFSVFFPENAEVALNQLRIFKDELGLLTTRELQMLAHEQKFLRNDHKNRTLEFGDNIKNGQVELSIDLRDWSPGDSLGFIAKKNVTKPVIWEKNANDKDDFFDPIPKVKDDRAFLMEDNRFHILSTRESILIPKEYACEMVSLDDTHGELRAHYAGFIDNGWGEKKHRPLTLEVRTFEPTLVYHGQPIGSVVLHRMYAPVDKGYDDLSSSNYSDQMTARLGKFFK